MQWHMVRTSNIGTHTIVKVHNRNSLFLQCDIDPKDEDGLANSVDPDQTAETYQFTNTCTSNFYGKVVSCLP